MDAKATAGNLCAVSELWLDADPRLQRRYHQLVVSHLSPSTRVAAGLRPPPSISRPFAAVQAAWRFYHNQTLGLKQLAEPLVQSARQGVADSCQEWVLVAMDWCNLHFGQHDDKSDRVTLDNKRDLGYELLTALAISDASGQPLAPLCLELRAADGTHSTRSQRMVPSSSPLDGLKPVMKHVRDAQLGKTPVFIVDREADSVGHYRQWEASGLLYLIRADDQRLVLHDCEQRTLATVADELKRHNQFAYSGPVRHKDRPASQYVAQTVVVLHRPARHQRVDRKTGKACHREVPGPALPLRLIASEVRRGDGTVLARWLLLTNLPERVEAARIALWYYWRWRIESYHKLLKGAGQQIEAWQQESAEALARRLLVAAMASVVVWRLAREEGEAAEHLRDLLIRLSGRQMKRTKRSRGFTEPALLAGLGVLMPMLDLLASYSVEELHTLADAAIPSVLLPRRLPLNVPDGRDV